jgi:hypothetical protein
MEHLIEYIGTASRILFIIGMLLMFLASIRKDLIGLTERKTLRRLIGYLGNVETEPKKEQRNNK